MAKIEISNDEVREQLAPILEGIKNNIDSIKAFGLRIKASPALSLYKRGCLTVDYLMAEHGKVLDKTSELSSSERNVITDIMGTALNRALRNKTQQITEKLN